jgi:hypothetical protein
MDDLDEVLTQKLELEGHDSDVILPSVKKNYAVCLYGQLRAVDTIIDNFNKNLIEKLDADLYAYVQITNTNIDNNIHLLNTENKIIYEPSDVSQTFINYHNFVKRNNYTDIGCLRVYENLYKIYEVWGDEFEQKYEYIILTRSDYLHLFPFPDIVNLCDDKDIFWCYDGHEWGGINGTFIVIPYKYVKKFLTSFYNYLQNSNNISLLNSMDLNAERFTKFIFETNNWKIGKISPNAFITASSYNEITTWGQVQYCETYKVFYKYSCPKNYAYDSLNKYNNNEKWTFKKNINTRFSYYCHCGACMYKHTSNEYSIVLMP